MDNTLKNKMVFGALWMMGMRLAIRSIGLVSTVILARILVPEDFGVVAMSMLLIGFIDVITTLRLELIIIREKNIEDKLLNTAWTLNIIRGVIVTAALIFCAPFLSSYFSEPKLTNVVYVLAIGVFIYSFANVGIALIQKNLEFSKEFKYNVLTKIGTFFITIFFVFYLENYWALIIGITSGMIINTILSYYIHAYRPSICFSEWKKLLSFSSIIMFSSIISFFNRKLAEIMIGSNRSTAELGNFTLAGNISTIATDEIITPIVKSLFPGYSKIASELDRLKYAFLNTSSCLMLLILPIGIGFYTIIPNIIPILLGDKWVSIIPICQILTLMSCVSAIIVNYYSILLSVGKEKLLVYISMLSFLINTPLIYWVVSTDGTLIDIAYAQLFATSIYTLCVILCVFKVLDIPLTKFYYMVRRPLIASYVMYYCVTQVSDFLVLKLITGVLIYTATLALLCWITDKKQSIEIELFTLGYGLIKRR